jgi:hypothetical protein
VRHIEMIRGTRYTADMTERPMDQDLMPLFEEEVRLRIPAPLGPFPTDQQFLDHLRGTCEYQTARIDLAGYLRREQEWAA